jgi:hypothetical protein
MLKSNQTKSLFNPPAISEKRSSLNFVKSVVYQWTHFFERPRNEKRIALFEDLLDEDIIFINSLLSVSGIENFKHFTNELEGLKISHFIEEIDSYPCGVGMYTVDANLRSQSTDKNGDTQEFLINFNGDVKIENDFKIKFLRLKVKDSDPKPVLKLQDNFIMNRACSVVHHCMGLVERNISTEKILDPIFTEGFAVNALYFGTIQSKAGIIEWINGIHKKIQNVSLTPVNIKANEINGNQIEVNFDLLIEGEIEEGERVESLSKNTWILEDNLDEIFSRVKMISVEKLDPIFI